MTRLFAAGFALSMLLSAGACGGDDADKFSAIADEACACSDKACADKVEEKWVKLEREMRDKYKDKKPDEAMRKKYKEAENKAEACLDKLDD